MQERPRSIYRIAAPIKSLARRFLYMGFVLGAFSLMLLGKVDAVLMERFRAQVTDAFAPILDAMSRPVATLADVAAQIQQMVDLRAENVRLQEDRTRLLQWQSVARRLEAENKTLRGLLNYLPGPDAGFISARVIADTGGAFVHSIVLNAGARDGVVKGQAVITGDGLVGRITGLGRRSSRILLITDINSRIPILVEQQRTRGILAGDNSDQPRLIHLPPGATVTPGARIVTSGHGGAFPPGLPIGVVTSVSDGGIKVEPFISRHRLEYVRVVDFGLERVVQLPQPAAKKTGKQVP
ncbi:MAG: rod shape-determining protein MreC [Proteobacteria bacterium]|nr:rod shape-determining protein MreC [Pseudomonadota bacterium]